MEMFTLFVWYGFGAETSRASELRALLEYGTNWRLCKRVFFVSWGMSKSNIMMIRFVLGYVCVRRDKGNITSKHEIEIY